MQLLRNLARAKLSELLDWLRDQGKLAEAETHYRRALDLDPNDIRSHNNLGWLLEQRGATADAEKHFRKALAIDPDYPWAHNNLGWLLERYCLELWH